MRVHNSHHRVFAAVDSAAVSALIDGLAGDDDRLWPHELWPAMRFDRPLSRGARGGHGPIGYRVADYAPGRSVRFAFTRPAGFHGHHEWVLQHVAGGREPRHTLVMDTAGRAMLSWPLIWRPMHDAVIEDALHKAAATLGVAEPRVRWSWRVRALRRAAVALGAA